MPMYLFRFWQPTSLHVLIRTVFSSHFGRNFDTILRQPPTPNIRRPYKKKRRRRRRRRRKKKRKRKKRNERKKISQSVRLL